MKNRTAVRSGGGRATSLLQPQWEALKRAAAREVEHQEHAGRHRRVAHGALQVAGRSGHLPHEDLVPRSSRLVRVRPTSDSVVDRGVLLLVVVVRRRERASNHAALSDGRFTEHSEREAEVKILIL